VLQQNVHTSFAVNYSQGQFSAFSIKLSRSVQQLIDSQKHGDFVELNGLVYDPRSARPNLGDTRLVGKVVSPADRLTTREVNVPRASALVEDRRHEQSVAEKKLRVASQSLVVGWS